MAQKVVTTLIDDMDGSEAADTITIGYKGYTYELDLSEKNLAKLEKAVGPFVQAGRRVGRVGGASRATREPVSKRVPSDSTTVRAWAHANGVDVPTRGRIPNAVREKFEAAQGR
jgi:Lsr2